MMEAQVIKVIYNWKKYFILPLISVIAFGIFYFYSMTSTLGDLDISIFVILLVLYYIFFIQFEVSNIYLFKDQNILKVSYPLGIFINDKVFPLKDVDKIHFKYDPGPYIPPRFYIYTKNGKKNKFYIPNKIERLSNELEKIGIDIVIE